MIIKTSCIIVKWGANLIQATSFLDFGIINLRWRHVTKQNLSHNIKTLYRSMCVQYQEWIRIKCLLRWFIWIKDKIWKAEINYWLRLVWLICISVHVVMRWCPPLWQWSRQRDMVSDWFSSHKHSVWSQFHDSFQLCNLVSDFLLIIFIFLWLCMLDSSVSHECFLCLF